MAKLLKQGRELDLLVHRQPYPASKAKSSALHLVEGDLLDREEMLKILPPGATIVNLAGAFFDSLYPANILANLNLLEACREAKPRKILFLSSQHIYGECSGKPFQESDTPQPVTLYGLTKYLAENIYRFCSRNYGIPCTILRSSTIYGPGQRAGVVFSFIDNALKSRPITITNRGKQIRDFLYVDDAVAAILKALDHEPQTGYEVFNIAGPEPRTLLDVISTIQKNLPPKIAIRYTRSEEPDIRWMWSDCQKAKSMLNYESKVSLEAGIPRTIEEIRSRSGKASGTIL